MTDEERDNTFDREAFVPDANRGQGDEPELTKTGVAVIALGVVAAVALGVTLHRDWILIVLLLVLFVALPLALRARRVRARRRGSESR